MPISLMLEGKNGQHGYVFSPDVARAIVAGLLGQIARETGEAENPGIWHPCGCITSYHVESGTQEVNRVCDAITAGMPGPEECEGNDEMRRLLRLALIEHGVVRA